MMSFSRQLKRFKCGMMDSIAFIVVLIPLKLENLSICRLGQINGELARSTWLQARLNLNNEGSTITFEETRPLTKACAPSRKTRQSSKKSVAVNCHSICLLSLLMISAFHKSTGCIVQFSQSTELDNESFQFVQWKKLSNRVDIDALGEVEFTQQPATETVQDGAAITRGNSGDTKTRYLINKTDISYFIKEKNLHASI